MMKMKIVMAMIRSRQNNDVCVFYISIISLSVINEILIIGSETPY